MKYHVYGIGNALVDKEFEVSDEFLAEMNIEKGSNDPYRKRSTRRTY